MSDMYLTSRLVPWQTYIGHTLLQLLVFLLQFAHFAVNAVKFGGLCCLNIWRSKKKVPRKPRLTVKRPSITHTALEFRSCAATFATSPPSFPLSSLVSRSWHIFTVELSWPRSWSASSARELQRTALVASQRSFSIKAERSLWISWSFSWSGWDLTCSSSSSFSPRRFVKLLISWKDGGELSCTRVSLWNVVEAHFHQFSKQALTRQTRKPSLFLLSHFFF